MAVRAEIRLDVVATMTCIIGMEHGGKVYIGADSISLNGWAKDITADKKVFRKGDLLFGVAGSPRQKQILQYHVVDMPHLPTVSDEEYLVRAVVEPARMAFRECGFTDMDNGRETGASFLIGYRGKLYSVENSFQLCRSARGFYAMGAGDDFAMGALQALMDADDNMVQSQFPETLLMWALETAEKLSACVCGPYHIEVLGGEPAEESKLSDEDAEKFTEVLVNGQAVRFVDKRFHEVKQWELPPEPRPSANPPSSINL